MPVIQSGHEVFGLVRSLLGERHGNGWACPWCRKMGAYEVADASTSDRLFLSSKTDDKYHPIRFVCRQASDGIVAHHPVHSIEELFEEFSDITLHLAPGKTWAGIAVQLMSIVGVATSNTEIDPAKAYWDELKVLEYHRDPRTHTEWEKLGFAKTTIDRLLLGVTPQGRLSIPIPYYAADERGFGLISTGKYVHRTRRAEGGSGPPYYWPSGLATSMWYIPQRETGDLRPVRIIEGDTSTIAAFEIWGDGPIATATAGAGSWSDNFSGYLIAKGHRKFVFYPDNDAAGQGYVQSAITSLRNVVNQHPAVAWDDIEILTLLWPDDTPDGMDVRSMLQEHGAEDARRKLDQWTLPTGWFSMRQPHVGRVAAVWDEEYAVGEYAPDVVAAKSDLHDLVGLRGDWDNPGLIHHEIAEFVYTYKQRSLEDPRGSILVVRSTPGVGKTRAAVRYVEDFAHKYLEKRKLASERLIARLENQPQTDEVIQKIADQKAEHYKKLSVIFSGAFIDGFEDILRHANYPKMWYNLKARSTVTCQNYAMTQKVANAGYGVMRTCCIEGGICPLQEACKGRIDGELQYLAQLEEVKYHPIVYVRHNHLRMKSLLQKAQLVVVDEDPSAIVLSSTTLTVNDLKKFDAYEMLEGTEDAATAQHLMDMLIEAVETWKLENLALHGRPLLNQLHVIARGDVNDPKTLHDVAEHIIKHGLLDEIATWRPMNFDTGPSGTIVRLLTLLVRDILRSEEAWNGQIFIENGAIIFYPMNPFEIVPKTPVVALDATAIERKYQLCFDRTTQEFRAEVLPSKATVHTVIDTENTMNTLLKGIGKRTETVALYGVRDSFTVAARSRPQKYAVLDDESKVYNAAMRSVIRATLGLTEKHHQLLLVTYKTARLFIEEFIKENFPDHYPCIGFGHFKGLRGSNMFEQLPAVLVAGTPRIPPDVLYKDLIAFYKDDPEPLDLKMTRIDEYYHLTPWRYSTMMLADPRVQDYVNELEAGEIQQVAGRIRAAVSDTEKYIYLMTARPAMPWMTYTGPGSEGLKSESEYDPTHDPHFRSATGALWWWFEAEQSVHHIQSCINKYGGVPSIRELMKESGFSYYQARKLKQFYETNYEE